MHEPELSIVIPCYNEEANAREIHAAVSAAAASAAQSYEIIFIDNGSVDRTRQIIRDICAGDPRTRAILNTRNYGQMRSPTHALYQTTGAGVISMCADFQDPPALIGPMVEQWRQGAQVVLGVRRSERATPLVRFIRASGYRFLSRFADYPVVPNATGFGLFSREVVDTLSAWDEPEPFFRGMVVESGYRVALLHYDRPERARGVTKNNFRALLDFALSGIAGSSKTLLRQPIILAFWAAVLAGALMLATGAAAIWHGPAWPLALIATQCVIFSVMLLFIGLIGEQVRVIGERTRQVPIVIEEERINFPPDRPRVTVKAGPTTRHHG